jgi:NAD(P)-dependent dehydrogenase (short-subunit alcohol dehydrogenase family)
MRDIEGAVAVVTGAGAGIGRAISLQLAHHGAQLALADANEQGLQETQELLGGRTESRRYVLDVADASAVEALAQKVECDFKHTSILVNNAGVTLIGDFKDVSLAEIEWLVKINFWGVVHGCKFFLPLLRRESDAHIVNISSLSGLLGLGGQTHYCASKFAVRGFTEALRQELLETNVKVTCVYPSYIRTSLGGKARVAANADPEEAATIKKLWYQWNSSISPDQAAHQVVKAILHDKSRLLIGSDARVVDTLQRLLPSRANSIIMANVRRLTKRLTSTSPT